MDQNLQVRIDYLLHHQQYIPLLAELLWKEWKHFYNFWNIHDLEGMKNEIRDYCKSECFPTSFVAIVDGQIAGIAILGDDVVSNAPTEPWLTTLFVLPQFRGLGIAKQLIHRGIQLAKRLGYSTLYLWTEDKQNMYSHLGWKVLHDAEYAGSKITIMSYDLTSESDSVSARTQTTNQ